MVGGDLTSGPVLVVTVAVTGTVPDGAPVLRSGARPGDALVVTGPLGRAAAGLRRLRGARGDGPGTGTGPVAGTDVEAATGAADALVDAHRRPVPRLAEGTAARRAGATAMMDLSDGLAIDLRRLADASGVGVVVEHLPVADGATPDEALGGGDDYELLLATPDPAAVARAFAAEGLAPPIVVGRCTDAADERRLGDGPLPGGGWEHRW